MQVVLAGQKNGWMHDQAVTAARQDKSSGNPPGGMNPTSVQTPAIRRVL